MDKKTTTYFLIPLFAFLGTFLMVATMNNNAAQMYVNIAKYDYESEGIWGSIAMSIMFAISFAYTIINIGSVIKGGAITRFMFVYALYVILMSFMAYELGPKMLGKSVIIPALGPMIFFIYYLFAVNNPNSKKMVCGFFLITMAIFPVVFKMLYSEKDFMGLHMTFVQGYYLLFLMPFFMLFKSRFLQYLLIFLIGMTLAISAKRGGLIAFVLGTYAYLFIQNFFIERKHRFFFMIVAPTIGILLLLLIFYYDSATYGFISKRFDDISETGGNGRVDLWLYSVKTFLSSSPLDMIIGQGAYTYVNPEMPIIGFAHNDFLSTIIYYGIIGFSLILGFTISFALKCLEMLKNRSQYSAPFAATFVIYIIMTMVSILFYMPAICFFLFAAMGYILGLYESEKRGMPALR